MKERKIIMADERKNIFINTVERLFTKYTFEDEIPQEAFDFFEDYKKGKSSNKKAFTDKGIKILEAMREINDWISAKSLGEKIEVSGRSVSGSMRKLIEDGYIERKGENPISYKITEKGMTCDLNCNGAEVDN